MVRKFVGYFNFNLIIDEFTCIGFGFLFEALTKTAGLDEITISLTLLNVFHKHSHLALTF